MTQKLTIKMLLLLISIVYSVATLYPAAAPIDTVYDEDKACGSYYMPVCELSDDKASRDDFLLNIKVIENSSLGKISEIVRRYQEIGRIVIVLIDIDDTVLKIEIADNGKKYYVPVHPKNVYFIQQMQQLPNVIVLGFTARKFQDAHRTEQNLKLLGIDYSLHNEKFNFQHGQFYPDCPQNQGFGYQNGIIYCRQYNTKGKALLEKGAKDVALKFFLHANIKKIAPNNNHLAITMADDKIISIAQVMKAIKEIREVEDTKEDGINIVATLCKITQPHEIPALQMILTESQGLTITQFEKTIIKGLLESDSKNNNQLLEVVLKRDKPMITTLLECKANPDMQSKYDKKTALMHAAENRQLGIMKLLLTAKADHTLIDADGRTALQIAERTMVGEKYNSFLSMQKLLS